MMKVKWRPLWSIARSSLSARIFLGMTSMSNEHPLRGRHVLYICTGGGPYVPQMSHWPMARFQEIVLTGNEFRGDPSSLLKIGNGGGTDVHLDLLRDICRPILSAQNLSKKRRRFSSGDMCRRCVDKIEIDCHNMRRGTDLLLRFLWLCISGHSEGLA
jgi:hypothetical protein